jgi:hypothetical protein
MYLPWPINASSIGNSKKSITFVTVLRNRWQKKRDPRMLRLLIKLY